MRMKVPKNSAAASRAVPLSMRGILSELLRRDWGGLLDPQKDDVLPRQHVADAFELEAFGLEFGLDLGDDAKIEVKTKTEVERDDADDKETETKTTLEGDLAGVPYLGVKSVKMVRSSCS